MEYPKSVRFWDIIFMFHLQQVAVQNEPKNREDIDNDSPSPRSKQILIYIYLLLFPLLLDYHSLK